MRFNSIATFVVFIGVLALARAEGPGKVNPLEAPVRAIISEKCGSCHDGALSSAKPAALKVFDLREADWTARMTDDQLRVVVERVKGKDLPAKQKAQVAQLMKQKRQERAAQRSHPQLPPATRTQSASEAVTQRSRTVTETAR